MYEVWMKQNGRMNILRKVERKILSVKIGPDGFAKITSYIDRQECWKIDTLGSHHMLRFGLKTVKVLQPWIKHTYIIIEAKKWEKGTRAKKKFAN